MISFHTGAGPFADGIGQIAALEQEIFSDPWSETAIRETKDNPQALIICAWEEEKLVGYVIFYYVLDEGEIARIAVHPAFRKRGIARMLLGELRRISDEKGIVRWLLDVRASNEPAISLYRGYGFVCDGRRKNFYTDPAEDAILMSCAWSQE